MVVLGLATAAEGHVNAFRKLRRAVYNVYYGLVGAASRTPLTLAAFRGHVDVVRELLEVKNVDVNQVDKYNITLLSYAAALGHVDVVRVLLEVKNVDVNKVDIHGQTPLSCAAEKGHVEVVRVLLEAKNVDVNKATYNGRTPLSKAAGNGHVEVVRMLFARSFSSANRTDSSGKTPLYWATDCCQMAMIKALIDLGAEPVDPDRLKALTRTVRFQVIKFLNVTPEWYDSAVDCAYNAGYCLVFLCGLPLAILGCSIAIILNSPNILCYLLTGGLVGGPGGGGGGRSGGGHGGP